MCDEFIQSEKDSFLTVNFKGNPPPLSLFMSWPFVETSGDALKMIKLKSDLFDACYDQCEWPTKEKKNVFTLETSEKCSHTYTNCMM